MSKKIKKFSQLRSFTIEHVEDYYVCSGSLQSVVSEEGKNPEVVFEDFSLNAEETFSFLQTNVFDVNESKNYLKKPNIPFVSLLESFSSFALNNVNPFKKKTLEVHCFDSFTGDIVEADLKVFSKEDENIVSGVSSSVLEVPMILSGFLLITSVGYTPKKINLNLTKDKYLEVLLRKENN